MYVFGSLNCFFSQCILHVFSRIPHIDRANDYLKKEWQWEKCFWEVQLRLAEQISNLISLHGHKTRLHQLGNVSSAI